MEHVMEQADLGLRILKTAIQAEADVVLARQRARQVAVLCGFGRQDQVRIATAVSELARNVYNYAGAGEVEFGIQANGRAHTLMVRVEDEGPGIRDVQHVMSGNYHSETGMGLGLQAVRRLMDQFDLKTGDGTCVTVGKTIPPSAGELSPQKLARFHAQVAMDDQSATTFDELRFQNHDLLEALAELNSRQEELLQLTRELEDTNRGVVALYAELDEKAQHLRRADEMKSRFLSNMSHEFRTPLSSIRGLANLLMSGDDGELNAEQKKQVRYITQSAESLTELVNDLLDLAKIESGRIDVNPAHFTVDDIFSALRGMLRPLLADTKLRLVFLDYTKGSIVFNDEAKLSQILRNFISNALKFTPRGEITVSASLQDQGKYVRFDVVDTGIGIAAEHHELIFEEFGQVKNPLQYKARGTGLGLPLCRKLAGLLGGRVEMHSVPDQGSTFSAIVQLQYPQHNHGETPMGMRGKQ
jgi:signal transduction histidine kinase